MIEDVARFSRACEIRICDSVCGRKKILLLCCGKREAEAEQTMRIYGFLDNIKGFVY